MKSLCLIATFSFVLFGCNMNPNKEARIQGLELEMAQTKEMMGEMEGRVQALEAENEALRTKGLKMEME